MVKGIQKTAGEPVPPLPSGLQLGSYAILQVVRQDRCSITYRALDCDTRQHVLIREHAPQPLVSRNTGTNFLVTKSGSDSQQAYSVSLDAYLAQARALARTLHPGIGQVKQTFRALGTAYYVTPCLQGQELSTSAPPAGELTEQWLSPLLIEVLDALQALHTHNLHHGELTPASILTAPNQKPLITRFGVPEKSIETYTGTVREQPGYTAPELLTHNKEISDSSDIYALGATCYRLITGARPASASARRADCHAYVPLSSNTSLAARFSAPFLAGIDKALAYEATQRWKSAREWQQALLGDSDSKPLLPQSPISGSLPPTKDLGKNNRNLPPAPPSTEVMPPAASRRSNVRKHLLWILPLLSGSVAAAVLLMQQTPQSPALSTPAMPQPATQPPPPESDAEEARAQRFINFFISEQESFARPCAWKLSTFSDNLKNAINVSHMIKTMAENKHADAAYTWACILYYGLSMAPQPEAGMQQLHRAAEMGSAMAQHALGWHYYNGIDAEQDLGKAAELYAQAANKGHVPALCSLAACHWYGDGMPRDTKTGLKLFEQAAEKGHPAAMRQLGRIYLYGECVQAEPERGLQYLHNAATANDYQAMLELGHVFNHGRGVTKNEKAADDFYEKGAGIARHRAEAQDTDALLVLGNCYQQGYGVPQKAQEAVKYYQQAATRGDYRAVLRLGMCYERGIGVKKDDRRAFAHYMRAAEKQSAAAQTMVAHCYELGIGVEQDATKAFELFRQASGRSFDALFRLGLCYEDRIGTEQNFAQAIACYQAAAAANVTDAQFTLGLCYANGQGVEQDTAKAFEWYKRAAENRHMLALSNLGILYEYGTEQMKPDLQKAFECYRIAAEHDEPVAQYNLGCCYATGRGTRLDKKLAVEWFAKAAARNYASAQFNMGVCYESGEGGLEKNYNEAIYYYTLAARQNLPEAYYNLGTCHERGKGTAIDINKAFGYFDKAARLGLPKAQYRLAQCYERGTGVQKDRQKAMEWYRKAAEQQHADAVKRLKELQQEK
ncbi:MAG: protein kinase [Akkermansia sp.]|nr:protein kinase [Akkermansia sp.]